GCCDLLVSSPVTHEAVRADPPARVSDVQLIVLLAPTPGPTSGVTASTQQVHWTGPPGPGRLLYLQIRSLLLCASATTHDVARGYPCALFCVRPSRARHTCRPGDICMFSLPFAVVIATASSPVRLAELLNEARKNNPELQSAHEQAKAAASSVAPAGALD